MLVLSRRREGAVVVTHKPTGQRLRIVICEVRDDCGKVRLGFDGPMDFEVHREEVQERVDSEQEAVRP